MKRFTIILSVVLILGLAVYGCCTLTAPDGTQTKSTANCFKTAQDKICNASPDVVSIADIVITLLKPELAVLVPGTAPFIALVTAQGIKDTGCAVITNLNTMIAFIQGMNTQAKLMVAKSSMKAAPVGINVQPLLDWRNGDDK